jgi:SpoVK/Ycf46/Vps4 family AAA+-type ATPase
MDNFVEFLDSYKQRNYVDYYDIIDILHATDVHYRKNNLNYYKNNLNYYNLPQPPNHKVIIDVSVNSLGDMIHIIDANPYSDTCEYNIDMKSLHTIRSELVELDGMIGMETLKRSVMNQLIYFIQNLHINDAKESDYKHTIICGPPGTGKTEAAQIVGRMYSKVGILRNSVFKKVTRSDLIAGYLGQTAIKTRKVINECLGGCLFIDEAYSLASGEDNDIYSKECIDTLCEALSDHKGDLMVIVAGYEQELNDTFFRVNRGLKSRFIWKFVIDDYSPIELMRIFEKKIISCGWKADCLTEQWFEKRISNFRHFGRDMDLLFSFVKICHSNRIFGKGPELRKRISVDDIENGYKMFIENSKNTKNKPVLSYYM